MVTKVDRSDIVTMLERAAAARGLTLARFYDLGRDDALEDANLRELWLIWGDELVESDVRNVA